MLNLGPYSTKEFPNIRVYPTVIDRILEGVAVLLAVAVYGQRSFHQLNGFG